MREAVPNSQNSSNPDQQWFLIVNPASGNGKGAALQPVFERLMKSRGILAGVVQSTGPGHLMQLSAEAVSKGYRQIAILGGDGTANEVINGFCKQKEVPSTEITVGMLSVGTGNDWMRTVGMPSTPGLAIDALERGDFRWHDVGRLHFRTAKEDKAQLRYFINIAGGGFDGEVTRRVADWHGFFAGRKLAYWITILRTLFVYNRTETKIEVDDMPFKGSMLSLAVGVCRYNGGGMMQLPEADFSDGLLDVSIIGKMSTLEMVYRLPAMLDGSFTKLSAVKTARGKKITLYSDPNIWVEVDGEIICKSPVEIDCIKRAFKVIVP
ncbi:MAG: YegS/Rv2252/BmrU family lipid kinase [Limisphaerales bacterium]|jgi:YegS/Rv2252/BmrU family lipid kinase